MRVAVMASGFDRDVLPAPWLALRCVLRAWQSLAGAPELVLLRFGHAGDEHFTGFDTLRLPRVPIVPALAAALSRTDVVLLNGAAPGLGSFLFNRFGPLPTVALVHGNLGYANDYTFGGPPQPEGRLAALRRRRGKQVLRMSARRIDRLVMNSEFTRRVWVEGVGVDPERASVSHLGVDHSTFHPVTPQRRDAVLSRFGVGRRYVLHVSNGAPVKNGDSVLAAHGRVRDDADVDLVIAGGGWSEARVRAVLGQLGRGRVKLVGQVGAPELAALYSGALVTLLPSLHETFCMPLLEAMACGSPVLASNWAAMPEIAGGAAALLENPRDVAEVAATLRILLRDEPRLAEMRERGLERAKDFSWDRTARDLIAAAREARHP